MKRREFLKSGVVTAASLGALRAKAGGQGSSPESSQGGCRVVVKGHQVELDSPAFVFHVETPTGLHASSWNNRLSGRTLSLGNGSELEIEVDAAEQRIWIPGWKATVSHSETGDPNQDEGFRKGYARPEFDDSQWRGMINLTLGLESATDFTWARTRVTIPAQAQGQTLFLTLGGFGLFDHRYLRVFLNGQELGTRRASKRWNEPLGLDLKPGSPAYGQIRFGQENVIAVQLSEFFARPARLDELDPTRGRALPGSLTWPFSPAPFEQYLTVGQPGRMVEWDASGLRSQREGSFGEAVFELVSKDQQISAIVTYRWDATQPVLHKFVEVTNKGNRPVRVLNVRLGDYPTSAQVSEGEQGFPVYLDDEFFMGLAHPYGWAIGQEGAVRLRHYPGTMLAPGRKLQCMEAVYGVGKKFEARKAFLAHLETRMRRIVRGHDAPRAIFEPFGARPGNDSFDETEEFLLDNIRKVAEGQNESGCHFDAYSIDFWVDYQGDLIRFDPKRFPNGPAQVLGALKKLGTAPGLWIDSSWERWSVGGNPAVKPTLMNDPQYGTEWMALCRATEPIKSMYSNAFRHHVRENGVRLIKFDNFRPLCYNPAHDHWPGVYSMEAVANAVIETFHNLDTENPEVFLMLYWGYRSPWWLLHADTLFESGLAMEAASPGPSPTLYARDSVTVGLDQAQWYCADVPRLGKDSLGTWLSDWSWNSSIGKERWQEGFIMDMCRGSMLAQPWSDTEWLSPPERKQMADFIALLKERPGCFRNARFILGNPWMNEPYGYLCSDGTRAFIALHNCTWKDVSLDLQLHPAWGLAEESFWSLYRWYPDPAQLDGGGSPLAGTVPIWLRPFEVVLLEAVPSGERASLGRSFTARTIPRNFEEASRELTPQTYATERAVTVVGETPASRSGGTLALTAEMRKGSVAAMMRDVGKHLMAGGEIAGRPATCHPVLGQATYPASWQAWRIPVQASAAPVSFHLSITMSSEVDATLTAKAYFLPT